MACPASVAPVPTAFPTLATWAHGLTGRSFDPCAPPRSLSVRVVLRGTASEEIESAALKLDNVARAIADREVRKVVVVPERIVNVVA